MLKICDGCGSLYAPDLAQCPHCSRQDYHWNNEPGPEPGPEPAAPIPVAEQKAAGVPPEETVTIAEQKAGVPPPVLPDPPDSTPPPNSPESSAPADPPAPEPGPPPAEGAA